MNKGQIFIVVRPGRIGLPSHPWQGRVLPLNHDRKLFMYKDHQI